MAELARGPRRPTIDLPVDHRAHADAATDGHDEKMLDTMAVAEPLLGDSQGVHVIVDVHRKAEALLKRSHELYLAPLQDGRRGAYPCVAVYDSSEANADPHDLGTRKVRGVQDLLDSPADGRDGCLGVLHALHRGQPVMEDIGFQVSQGADDRPLGQLQPDDEPG